MLAISARQTLSFNLAQAICSYVGIAKATRAKQGLCARIIARARAKARTRQI